jgi:ethanolamine utilization protein EutM
MSNSVGLIESKGLVALIEATDVILKNSPVKFLGIHKLENGLVSIAVSGNSDYVRAAIDSGTEAGRKVGEIYSSSVIDNPTKELLDIFSELFSATLSVVDNDKNTKSIFVSSKISELDNKNDEISNDINLNESKIKDEYRREKSKPLLVTKISREPRLKSPKGKGSSNIQLNPEEMISKKDELKTKKVDEVIPEIKIKNAESSGEFPKSISTIERLRNEALGLTKKRLENIGNVKIEDNKKTKRKISKDSVTRTEVDFNAIKEMNVHKLRNYARSFSNFPIKGREISRANRDKLIAFFKTISS